MIDYVANSPKEEITRAFKRTPSSNMGRFGSIEGRAVCLFKVGMHGIGIVAKPLMYLGLGAAEFVVFSCCISVSPRSKERYKEIVRNQSPEKETALYVLSYPNHPE